MLRDGDLLAIFPEGGITQNGEVQAFKGGIMKILENAGRDGLQVRVIPMALTNLWGSYFSRIEQGGAMVRPFRRGLFNRVGLNVGEAMPAARATPEGLRARVAELMAAYVNHKRRQRVVDFDDLLRLAARDLRADPVYASGRQWMNRFLFVDEFQDVNPRQFQLLSAWMGEGAHLTVVGDPHQAIYAWNGADASYLVDMPRYFQETATVSLTRNYRSSPQILTVANQVLRDGSDQRGAALVPTRPDGPIPTIAVHPDEVQEARHIARELRSARRPGRRWADLAVLVRTNAQLAPLTQALGAAGIPHRTRGGGGLLDQPEVNDALRSLRRAREVGTWIGDLARELRELRPQIERADRALDPESEDADDDAGFDESDESDESGEDEDEFAPEFERSTPEYLWWNGQRVPWGSATVHLASTFWSGVTAIFEGRTAAEGIVDYLQV